MVQHHRYITLLLILQCSEIVYEFSFSMNVVGIGTVNIMM